MATVEGLAQELQSALQTLSLSGQQGGQFAEALDKLRRGSDGAIQAANTKIA